MTNKTIKYQTSFIENIKDNLFVIIVFSVAALIMIIGLWFPFVSFILAIMLAAGVAWLMWNSWGFC